MGGLNTGAVASFIIAILLTTNLAFSTIGMNRMSSAYAYEVSTVTPVSLESLTSQEDLAVEDNETSDSLPLPDDIQARIPPPDEPTDGTGDVPPADEAPPRRTNDSLPSVLNTTGQLSIQTNITDVEDAKEQVAQFIDSTGADAETKRVAINQTNESLELLMDELSALIEETFPVADPQLNMKITSIEDRRGIPEVEVSAFVIDTDGTTERGSGTVNPYCKVPPLECGIRITIRF